MIRSTRVTTTAALIALGVLAAACGGSSDQAEVAPDDTGPAAVAEFDGGTPSTGGKVTWGLEAETDGLNPVSGRFVNSGHLMASAIFDPLVTLDADGNWQPYLAESIEPNDDHTVWTVTLRDGVSFHDGKPLTADAVATVLNLHRDSAISKGAVYDISSVEATGPLTVTITTLVPWPTMPYIFASQVGYVPSPDMLDVPEEARTPIGTGPFRFQEWDYGVSFSATKNPDYWGRDAAGVQLPYLDAIEFRPMIDPQQRTDALLRGDIDILITPTVTEIRRLEQSPGVKTLVYDEGEEEYVTLLTSTAPFDNVNARLAVAHATDVDALIEEFGPDYLSPAGSLWAPGQPGYREDAGRLPFDLEKAKEYVAAYTAETGQPLSFALVGTDSLYAQQRQQALKAQWEAAGMQVTLDTKPQAELVVSFALGNYQAGLSRLYGFPEPDSDQFFIHSRSIDPALISFNIPRFADARIDAALDRARSSTDEAERDEAFAEVARVLNESAPVVFLWRAPWAIASSENVHGYGLAANGTIQTLGSKTWIATLWKG